MAKSDESFEDSIDDDIQPQIINLQREQDTTTRIVTLRITNAENVKDEFNNKKFTVMGLKDHLENITINRIKYGKTHNIKILNIGI